MSSERRPSRERTATSETRRQRSSTHGGELAYSTLFITYPYRCHQEQNIDTHQVGWIDLTLDAQGHGSLTDSWSNGKQTSGNTFYAVVLVGKDGKVVYSDKQTKGLDGSWGGLAREGQVTTNFTLTKGTGRRFRSCRAQNGRYGGCGQSAPMSTVAALPPPYSGTGCASPDSVRNFATTR
jgi:hypothetical protein